MSKSLQDQLLELGLARERPTRTPAKRRKRPAQQSAGKKRAAATGSDANLSLEEAYRLRQKHDKEQALAAKRRKQEEDRRRRELNEAIRAIVDPHRLNDPAAEEARYFMYKERIRKVYVTPEQLAAINEGGLGIVYLAGGYHLLAPEHIEAVRALSPEHVPDLGAACDGAEADGDADAATGTRLEDSPSG